MSGRIVLFGATGYTGGRTAEVLVGRGVRPVLAGRDAARLVALGERLGCPTATADVTDVASVSALVGPDDVLVTTVGPFARLGGAALAAVVSAGATYLDSTGEPPFVREVFELQGPAAERSGARLLTAFGHDYVPGVLAGALALREAGDRAARVDVGYFLSGRGRWFSRGTVTSLIAIAGTPGYTLRHGTLRTENAGARLRTYEVDGRPRPGVSIGGVEQFALPRLHPGLGTVDVHLGWFGAQGDGSRRSPAGRVGLSGVVHATSRLPAPPAPLLAGLARLAGRLPRDPSAEALARCRSHVVAEVFDAYGTLLARTRLTAPDPYALTADLLAWGAARALAHGVTGVGALDPVGAFGLDALVEGAASAGLTTWDLRATRSAQSTSGTCSGNRP
ncbi:saccharopine dehydrogenase [Pseudonocardia sp. RS11V-5]|uniref:saccharopine dehydrogenase family protein n=1 Tax=Pseudonocardia terrae TaxID=2905831 RepID=UPI001E2C9AE2|nr:saccharopine dehydrogenase [Pseudonocardia terrae]MCE3550721.1 saccharopine dehydrogenase [Pseudonocardia terrae]